MKQNIEIISILKEYHKISGFRISIHNLDFQEIFAYPERLSPFCSKLQENSKSRKTCIENDIAAFKNVKESGDVYLYKCKFGLYEAIAPIYHFGVLSGYLMMGQIIDNEDSSKDIVRRNSIQNSSSKEVLEAIEQIHIIDKNMINSYISIMTIIAEYITQSNRLNPYTHDLAQLVKKHINQNYSKKLSLYNMCDHFRCSKSTLMNNFKRQYGITINTYINDVRIKHAKDLLTYSNDSIKDISSSCGFSDQNYFSKTFTDLVGQTPTQFRKKL
ncbi:MAG: PocR ligand-binding domain-containing protein [Oscillospiraceae bacterium]|nr:PocR ligand-binding domain-containing protein [Oscillospiraceae bacterium]